MKPSDIRYLRNGGALLGTLILSPWELKQPVKEILQVDEDTPDISVKEYLEQFKKRK